MCTDRGAGHLFTFATLHTVYAGSSLDSLIYHLILVLDCSSDHSLLLEVGLEEGIHQFFHLFRFGFVSLYLYLYLVLLRANFLPRKTLIDGRLAQQPPQLLLIKTISLHTAHSLLLFFCSLRVIDMDLDCLLNSIPVITVYKATALSMRGLLILPVPSSNSIASSSLPIL